MWERLLEDKGREGSRDRSKHPHGLRAGCDTSFYVTVSEKTLFSRGLHLPERTAPSLLFHEACLVGALLAFLPCSCNAYSSLCPHSVSFQLVLSPSVAE